MRRRFVAHAETAVLGDAALGDVELAHDLDARNDGGVPVLRDGRHGVVQDAVDAVLDDDFLIARFDVDVGGAAFEGVEDGGIDELDDRRDVAVDGGEAVDGKRFVGVVLVADDVEREAFGDLFEDALGLLGLLEEVGDLGGGGDFDAELLVEEEAEFVDGVEVAGIGEGDFEGSVLRLEGHEVVTEHEVDGDGAEEVVLDGAVAEVDEFAAIAGGDGAGFGELGGGGRAEGGNGERGLVGRRSHGSEWGHVGRAEFGTAVHEGLTYGRGETFRQAYIICFINLHGIPLAFMSAVRNRDFSHGSAFRAAATILINICDSAD